jgi:hypothetical protein
MNQRSELDRRAAGELPWWVATIVVLGALLTAAGGIIALVRPEMLLDPSQPMNAGAYVYAGYLVSRDLALAAMLLASLAVLARRALPGARWVLIGLMVFTALVQLIDAAVDLATGRASLLPILLLFAVAFLVGAFRLAGQPRGALTPKSVPDSL